MLEVDERCKEHLAAVMAFAKEHGLGADLQRSLDYLGNYACTPNDPRATRCVLFWDHAPHSFAFTMYQRPVGTDGQPKSYEYKHWFSGGLIFHPGAGRVDESMSVSLGSVGPVEQDKPRWEVHT